MNLICIPSLLVLVKYHLEKKKLMYSVIIQWYTKIHVKKNASHCSQVKYSYAINFD